ncbi:hypothetical protein EO95_14365 [Methanosarcina sp. 1.H.T.1A.1]|uniref:DUF7847 domain-containing protein n=1 Tax=unclassified Methanosarcina TaxID=2644672 RepID=UPI0006212C75|nr:MULTISPECIES: hypothetical protein [unclassified Methanosarcina]KKH45426.1 hypothetical protein EO93_18525 [Methanosarcina sp. 1.H.A.2.2]KKH98808.1 hypothetical protein EO95_14365 [Methanosarcina sp. 1.H.T.1A.1]
MHEDFGTTLNRGFKTWTRNLNICIPFILNFFVSLIVYVFFFGLMGFLLFASSTGSIADPSTLPPAELYKMLWEGFRDNMAVSVLAIIVFSLLGMFLQAFFTAGAIGMAKKASETGDTVLSDMFRSGSKNAFRLFLTSLLVTLMLLAGIVFIVPGALTIGDLSGLIMNPEAVVEGMGALAIGILVWGIYSLTINIVLSLAPYALVIDELDPLDALKTGYRFFKKNKLDVFLIWIITVGLALANGLVGELLGSENTLISGITYIIPLLVLQPLTAVLWTRLYLAGEERELYNHYDLLSDPDGF